MEYNVKRVKDLSLILGLNESMVQLCSVGCDKQCSLA